MVVEGAVGSSGSGQVLLCFGVVFLTILTFAFAISGMPREVQAVRCGLCGADNGEGEKANGLPRGEWKPRNTKKLRTEQLQFVSVLF